MGSFLLHARAPRGFLAAVALAVVCAGSVAGTAAGAASHSQLASVALINCHSVPGNAGRYATFAAQMRAVPGSARMSMRLSLLERTPLSPGFHSVAAPGLGTWQTAAPGIGIFRFSQEIADLAAPADYRIAVRYRWLDAAHRVLRSAMRVSGVCRVPDGRPDLSAAA